MGIDIEGPPEEVAKCVEKYRLENEVEKLRIQVAVLKQEKENLQAELNGLMNFIDEKLTEIRDGIWY